MPNDKKNFALIGYPLGHSMSAVIHKELFKISNLDGEYSLIEVSPDNLESIYAKLTALDGFNVTIPHKINIIPFLDELSKKAKLFGSVNTVAVKNGRAFGYNTDCNGFLRALEGANIPLKGKVLLCGSGGVSRMFAFESALAGADLTLAVREADVDAAKTIRKEMQSKLDRDCKVILLSEAKEGYDLVINGTPVGMHPNTNACPVDKKVIISSGAAFDAVYNPKETMFIRYAKRAGIKYSNGLPMLVWQAAVAEEIWNGVSFSNKEISRVIELTQKELDKK